MPSLFLFFWRSAYFLEVEDLDEVAHDLIYAAEKYEMNDLVDECVETLVLNMKRHNVLKPSIIAQDKGISGITAIILMAREFLTIRKAYLFSFQTTFSISDFFSIFASLLNGKI